MIAVIAMSAVIAIIAMIVVGVVGVVGVICAVIAIVVTFPIIARRAPIVETARIVLHVVIVLVAMIGQSTQKESFLQELEIGKGKQSVILSMIKRRLFVDVSSELLKSSRQKSK